MKSIVFDSGTIINLALNNMLWILGPLKKRYKGEFYITPQIKKEIIDVPFQIKRFKLESLQIQNEINKGVLTVYEEDLTNEIDNLTFLANELISAKGTSLKLIDAGEISGLVLTKKINAEAFFVDERTTRLLVESPETLAKIFREKLHTKIKLNSDNLKIIKQTFSNIPILRSTELGIAAYEMGILKDYALGGKNKEVLDAVLWGFKLHGCSISENEINEALQLEK
jgi:predicted nucleic acid-binding protein